MTDAPSPPATCRISTGALTAEISGLGAELRVLKDDAGRDLLWDGDPAFWTGRAPVLFPIVGRLKGDAYTIDGTTFPMRQHGFARTSIFEVVAQEAAACRLRLRSSEATLRIYPFAFTLEVDYRLTDATLDMRVEVTNDGPVPMPIACGFHPAFRWPLPYGGERAAHEMLFEHDEPAPVPPLDGGLLSMPLKPSPVQGRRLPLTDALFADDAVIFLAPRSRTLRYGPPGGRGLTFDFADMPQLGIWSKPGAGFVCVEPWHGLRQPRRFRRGPRRQAGHDPAGADGHAGLRHAGHARSRLRRGWPMRIEPFGVEIWMNRHETRCTYNLAETCVESLTVAELLDLAGRGDEVMADLRAMKLTYGAIEGSDRLRGLIAGLYERQAIGNVLVTHGAIGANALVYETLVEPGDRVIAVHPTYQQHHAIPASFGADLVLLPLREAHGFLPDLAELDRLASPGTKLIVLNNPNNPTGALMDRDSLGEVAAIARRCGAWVLCDEVYRGIDQVGEGTTASIADIYEKGISTGSMSKAFSLAGLRLGWIVAPPSLLEAASIHRDYTTISVGMLDDYFAALALAHRDKLLDRNRRLVRRNLGILDAWVQAEPTISYVKPQSGTTALLRYDLDLSSEALCAQLLDETGVLLMPGSALGMEGTLRIGYANGSGVLRQGLAEVSGFLRRRA